MEFTDIVIVILMFAAPILSAIIDHQKKAKQRASRASGQQGPRPGEFRPFTYVDPEMPDDDDDDPGFSPVPEPKIQTPVSHGFAEGEHSISRDDATAIPKAGEEVEGKERIDARKLIIYDAIMNPKFKE